MQNIKTDPAEDIQRKARRRDKISRKKKDKFINLTVRLAHRDRKRNTEIEKPITYNNNRSERDSKFSM